MLKEALIASSTACVLCVPTHDVDDHRNVTKNIDITNLVIGKVGNNGRVGTCFPIKKIVRKNRVVLQFLTARHNVRVRDDSVADKPRYLVSKPKYTFKADRIELYRLDKLIYGTKIVRVLRESEKLDSAILEIDIPKKLDIKLFKLSSKAPKPGQRIWAFGCQLGIDPVLTEGLVVRLDKMDYLQRKACWIVSAPTFGGASGGPVIDPVTGEVVGVTVAQITYGVGPFRLRLTHVHIIVDASIIQAWVNSP